MGAGEESVGENMVCIKFYSKCVNEVVNSINMYNEAMS